MKIFITFCSILVFALFSAEFSSVRASENKTVSKSETAKILIVGDPGVSVLEEITRQAAAAGIDVVFARSIPETPSPLRDFSFPLILKAALVDKVYPPEIDYSPITARDAFNICPVKSLYRRPMNIQPYNGVSRNIQPRALL